MRRIFSALIFFCITYGCYSQANENMKTVTGVKGISVSIGVNVPVGDFASTHIAGIAIDCSPARVSFRMKRIKKIAFTYNGGVALYLGKKETVSNYSYTYPAYFFINAYGGVLYNPMKGGSITLTAGPTISIYNGNTEFSSGSKLEASYYISPRIAIGPGIMLMKLSKADPIWAASFKVTLNFDK